MGLLHMHQRGLEHVHQHEVLAVHFHLLVGAHQHQQRPPPHPQQHKLLVVNCVQH